MTNIEFAHKGFLFLVINGSCVRKYIYTYVCVSIFLSSFLQVTNIEFAHKGFLFLVINALFINEAVHVPGVMFDKRFFSR